MHGTAEDIASPIELENPSPKDEAIYVEGTI